MKLSIALSPYLQVLLAPSSGEKVWHLFFSRELCQIWRLIASAKFTSHGRKEKACRNLKITFFFYLENSHLQKLRWVLKKKQKKLLDERNT